MSALKEIIEHINFNKGYIDFFKLEVNIHLSNCIKQDLKIYINWHAKKLNLSIDDKKKLFDMLK